MADVYNLGTDRGASTAINEDPRTKAIFTGGYLPRYPGQVVIDVSTGVEYVATGVSVDDWIPAGASGGSGSVDPGIATGGLLFCGLYRGVAPQPNNIPSSSGVVLTDAIFGSDLGLGNDQDILVPWFLPAPITVSAFKWRVHSDFAAAGKYRLGLYRAGAGAQPSSLKWQSPECDGTDTTLQSSAGLTLPAGLYLVAACADPDAITNQVAIVVPYFPSWFDAASPGPTPFPWVDLGFQTTDLDPATADASPVAFYRSRAYGAFPDPGGNWDDVAATTAHLQETNNNATVVGLFATVS